MTEAGHIRLNGRRVKRGAARVCVGDVLALPLAGSVHMIEILALPKRRRPAVEVHGCYRTLDAARSYPIAEPETRPEYQGDSSP